jgi:hypothetical protein
MDGSKETLNLKFRVRKYFYLQFHPLPQIADWDLSYGYEVFNLNEILDTNNTTICLNVFCTGQVNGLNVHLVKPDSGFFVDTPVSAKELALISKDNPSSSPLSSPGTSSKSPVHQSERLLSVDRFSVAFPNLPTTVEAAYGPFSTRQTIPAQRILLNSGDFAGRPPPFNYSYDYLGQVPSYQQSTLDLTAHIVTK